MKKAKNLLNHMEVEFLKTLSYQEINDIINEFKNKLDKHKEALEWSDSRLRQLSEGKKIVDLDECLRNNEILLKKDERAD
jgi:hypothetical protein